MFGMAGGLSLRYISTHPFGPVNSTALRLRPMQQALIALIQCDPSFLSELFRCGCGGGL